MAAVPSPTSVTAGAPLASAAVGVGRDHRGRGRQTAVDEAEQMGLVERLHEAAGEPHDAPRGQSTGLGDHVAEGAAARVLDGDEQPAARRVAVGLELGGGGLADPAGGVGLAHHAVDERVVLHRAGAQHVHAPCAAGGQVRGLVHVGRGAPGEARAELVIAEGRRVAGGALGSRVESSIVHGVSSVACAVRVRRDAVPSFPGRTQDEPAGGASHHCGAGAT
jgi:hypothetical protein